MTKTNSNRWEDKRLPHDAVDISVVIPTNGRVTLVERLLQSLVQERDGYLYGKTEVLVVNSGSESDAREIRNLCQIYDARFIPGENSVRKKRNEGIRQASYDIILFLDSDVVAEPGLLKAHAETYLYAAEKTLGGVFGVTRFVGKKTWWWKVVEQTTYLDAFSFAERFPYNAWTIGNNVSFYRRILEEVGLFEENFPFPLGGDDLDLSYRITKAGYAIKSCPLAVTLHTTDTWNHPKAIYDRTRRWGSMEYYLSQRHPEIFTDCIPKSGILFSITLFLGILLSLATRSLMPLRFALFWFLIYICTSYTYDCIHHEGGEPLPYLLGKSIRSLYRLHFQCVGVQKGDFRCFHQEMSFSLEQTKYMQRREIAMFEIFLLSWMITLVGFLICP